MIHKPKGRKYYVVRFRFNGKSIQKRTRATNQKDAKKIESTVRSELALGNFGILKPAPVPTLAEFVKKDFLPYTESKFQAGSSDRSSKRPFPSPSCKAKLLLPAALGANRMARRRGNHPHDAGEDGCRRKATALAAGTLRGVGFAPCGPRLPA